MNFNLILGPDRWADLLTHLTEKKTISQGIGEIVSSNGKYFIHITQKNLEENEILAISQDMSKRKLPIQTIQKLQSVFQNYLNHQRTLYQQEITTPLHTFSARFSLWVNNHPLLARILSAITFGFLDKFLNYGNLLLQRANDSQAFINNFQHFVDNFNPTQTVVENTETTVEKAFFPLHITGINEILVEYLNHEEKHIALGFAPLRNALLKNHKVHKFNLIASYQKMLLPLLDPTSFASEIRQIKLLKSKMMEKYGHCRPDCECPNLFNAPLAGDETLHSFVGSKISKIFGLEETSWHLNSRPAMGNMPAEIREEPASKVKELASNKAFALLVVKICRKAYEYLNNDFKLDKKVILAALSTGSGAFKHIPESLKNNRDFVLDLISQEICSIHFNDLSDQLKADDEIMLALIKKDPACLEFAPQYQNNKIVVLELVKKNGYVIRFASDALKQDPEVVKAAVSSSHYALAEVAPQFRNSKEIILLAVRAWGLVLQDLSADLQDDYDIVLNAVDTTGSALKFASERLKKNFEIVFTAVSRDGQALNEAPFFWNNKTIVSIAVKTCGSVIEHATEELKRDPEIFLAAVTQHGNALQFGNEAQCNDKTMVLAAVSNYGKALQWASDTLKQDKDISLAAVEQDIEAFQYTLLKEDKDVALAVVQQDGAMLHALSAALQNNEEVVLAAVKQNGMALRYASPELRNNKKIVLAALQEQPLAIEWVSAALREHPEIKNFLEYQARY